MRDNAGKREALQDSAQLVWTPQIQRPPSNIKAFMKAGWLTGSCDRRQASMADVAGDRLL